jgi:hypothetical protein
MVHVLRILSLYCNHISAYQIQIHWEENNPASTICAEVDRVDNGERIAQKRH